MKPEQAALAALYPVLAVLCLIGFVRFLPSRKLLKDSSRSLVNSVLILIGTLGFETLYYGFARFRPSFYEILGSNLLIVAVTKLGYIIALVMLIRAYWEITDLKPGRWTPVITAFVMWLVIAVFVVAQ